VSGTLFGIHPVLEAIRARPRSITRVLVAAGRRDARIEGLVSAARRAGVVVQRQPREAIDRLANGGVHQGVVALVSGAEYADPEQVLERSSSPALLLVLDGVEDPRNLGAVIRSAAAAGADGVFLPSHGAAGLGPVAVKTSAGAVERMPVARVGNVVAFLKRLKARGVWVVGLDPEGRTPWTAFDLAQPVALVVGGEGRGLRRLARETCDALLSIPMRGEAGSLNLSVAAGIVLFEAVRQRLAARRDPKGGRPTPIGSSLAEPEGPGEIS